MLGLEGLAKRAQRRGVVLFCLFKGVVGGLSDQCHSGGSISVLFFTVVVGHESRFETHELRRQKEHIRFVLLLLSRFAEKSF